MRKGIGYIRVSRVAGRGGETFISPDVQRQRILETAKANDIEIIDWQEDLDQSGSKYHRPGFQAALEAVERRRASCIVVARLTRFARSVLDTHRALERLEACDGQLVAGDINVDTTTATGRLIRDMLTSLAAFELEVARENWQTAKSNAVARGVKISNRAPIGYRFDDSHRLEPDPATGHLIAEVFRMRLAGHSHKEIVRWWAEQTGVWIAHQTVGDIIRNRSYLGEVHYGGMVNTDAHPPLVDRPLFESAQSARVARVPIRDGSLLAGVLVCSGCSRPMTTSTGARLANGEPRLMYRCQKLSKDGPCRAPASVIRGRADEYVERIFLDWARRYVATGVSDDDGAVAEAVTVLRRAEAELGAYMAADLLTVVGAEAFRAGAELRQRAVDVARLDLERAHATVRVESIQSTLVEQWPNLTLLERRRLVLLVIERVVVHRRSDGRVLPFEDRCVVVWRD